MGQSIGEKSGRLRHARFRAEDTGGKVFLGCEKIEKEITLLESLVLRFFFFVRFQNMDCEMEWGCYPCYRGSSG